MVELHAQTPGAEVLPIAGGSMRLEQIDLGQMTSIAPFAGQQSAIAEAMQKAHGVTFPAPNCAELSGEIHSIWFGRDMALLAGPPPDQSLQDFAATTDQSDAWAAFTLAGQGARDVLARLVPVDVRAAAFGEGQTRRTLVGHMNVSITRLTGDVFLILVFRSMTETLVKEMQEAMEAVAARG